MRNKNKLILLVIFPLLFGLLVGILMLDPVIAQPAKTRVDETVVSNFVEPNDRSAFNVPENSPLTIKEGDKELAYEGLPQDSEIKFNALGLKWEGEIPEGASAEFYYKVENGDWQKLEMMEEDMHYSNLMSGEGYNASFKVVLKRDHAAGSSPVINSVKFYFLDTTQGPDGQNTGNLRGSQTVSNPSVIERESWGADESFRFWSPEYEEPKKFVIHHTAGGDGGDDGAATVRAIYYWHAVVLGWGDIGYNFLVDGQGNVYEGRYGGNGVVGAHTYNDIKNINYNEGTIGISVMGCYDTDGCSDPDKFTKTIRASLTSLIAQQARQQQIKPKGKSTIFDVKTKNIVGHRKLDATTCPGNRIVSKMWKIRNIARNKYYNNQYFWRGKFKDSTVRTAYLTRTTVDVTVKYKNTGIRTWGKNKTWLKMYNNNKDDKVSEFRHKKSWGDLYGKFYFEEEKVKPGETATFNFKMRTPKKAGEYENVLKLFINKNRVKKSKEVVTTRIDPVPNK
ncbi:N-acetylmuramoyl-L-alanine amidase [Patescibacteria group bacterium]|nr:N-acetylmuramoyl-L-alanine amidase [Patescibacteria group bacterium]MBU1673192.1 N-acetylmuramoyl-L-alanine amidase [Patescibacteria group bacterium]MBU1963028.1 N-acetylmuramoyl-L-alanine amidase [Patescibacteria group bacterium]